MKSNNILKSVQLLVIVAMFSIYNPLKAEEEEQCKAVPGFCPSPATLVFEGENEIPRLVCDIQGGDITCCTECVSGGGE